jgi:glycosyltransferase involved in cell wall biosynthesis
VTRAPRVSVSVPMYNGADFIGECIQSVLDQTFEDFELLLVDDASDDDTIKIVRSFGDSRIRIIENPVRLGAEGNWNAALSHSRGEYVKILSHDDVIYPTCLERQLSILDQDPELVWVTVRRDIIDGQSRVLMRNRGLAGLSGRIESPGVFNTLIRSGTNIFGEGAAVLVRRDAAVSVGEFDGRRGYVIDLDMWARLLLNGPAYALDETLAVFRLSEGQWSVSLGRQQARQVRELFAELRARPGVSVGRFDAALGWWRAGLTAWMRRVAYLSLRLRRRLATRSG